MHRIHRPVALAAQAKPAAAKAKPTAAKLVGCIWLAATSWGIVPAVAQSVPEANPAPPAATGPDAAPPAPVAPPGISISPLTKPMFRPPSRRETDASPPVEGCPAGDNRKLELLV
jgi:hypothetical protein